MTVREIKEAGARRAELLQQAEGRGQSLLRWHIFQCTGGRKESSIGKRVRERFAADLSGDHVYFDDDVIRFPGLPDRKREIDVVVPVVEVRYRDSVSQKQTKRKVRWPMSDKIWIRCVLDAPMAKMLRETVGVKELVPEGGPTMLLEGAATRLEPEIDEPDYKHYPETVMKLQADRYVDLEDPDVMGPLEDQLDALYGHREGTSSQADKSSLKGKKLARTVDLGHSGTAASGKRSMAGTPLPAAAAASAKYTGYFVDTQLSSRGAAKEEAEPRMSSSQRTELDTTAQIYAEIRLPEGPGTARFFASYLALYSGKVTANLFAKYVGLSPEERNAAFQFPRGWWKEQRPDRNQSAEGKFSAWEKEGRRGRGGAPKGGAQRQADSSWNPDWWDEEDGFDLFDTADSKAAPAAERKRSSFEQDPWEGLDFDFDADPAPAGGDGGQEPPAAAAAAASFDLWGDVREIKEKKEKGPPSQGPPPAPEEGFAWDSFEDAVLAPFDGADDAAAPAPAASAAGREEEDAGSFTKPAEGQVGPASKGMLDEGGVDFAALAGEDADAFAMPDDAFFDDFGDDGLFDLPDEE